MDMQAEEKIQSEEKKQLFGRFKKPGKQFFWAWVTYQFIKGTLTTTFIWVPMLYMWWTHSS